MTFTGRYHLVRNWWLPTQQLSAPFVLDRRDKALRPYGGAEWEPIKRRDESLARWEQIKQRGLDTPARRRLADKFLQQADCQALSAIFAKGDLYALRLFADTAMGSVTTVALSSTYTAGAGGAAYGLRYLAHTTKTLDSVYFNIGSFTGTAANVNDINLELRPEASTGAGTPNTGSLTESKTKDPASATGWIAVTGWTSVLTALGRYYIIIGDADGNGTDFATCSARSVVLEGTTQSNYRLSPVATTAGWTSGNTFSTTAWPKIVLGFSDGSAIGDPLTANTAPASDTNRRGLRITTSGLIASLPIFGALWTGASANISGMEIYNNANVPGTSPVNTSTDIVYSGTATRIGCLTSGGTPYTLVAGDPIRIVATISSATASGPQRIDIGTGEDATLRKALPGGGEFYFTRANGTTDWTNDLVGSLPAMGLLVDGQVAPSGGTTTPAGLINRGLIHN